MNPQIRTCFPTILWLVARINLMHELKINPISSTNRGPGLIPISSYSPPADHHNYFFCFWFRVFSTSSFQPPSNHHPFSVHRVASRWQGRPKSKLLAWRQRQRLGLQMVDLRPSSWRVWGEGLGGSPRNCRILIGICYDSDILLNNWGILGVILNSDNWTNWTLKFDEICWIPIPVSIGLYVMIVREDFSVWNVGCRRYLVREPMSRNFLRSMRVRATTPHSIRLL